VDTKSHKKARGVLAVELLIDSTSVHTETGNHAAVLVDLKRWAKTAVKRAARTLSFEKLRNELQTACRGQAFALQSASQP
jgi:ribosomal protein S13